MSTGIIMTAAAPAEPAVAHAYARHKESVAHVSAVPAVVFERLDDQERLPDHLRKPSAMMGGGRMTYDLDAEKGHRVGSQIRMGGSASGVLAGCVTGAPANESGMCHAGMPAKSNEAGPAAVSADMMKHCTMIKEMATRLR